MMVWSRRDMMELLEEVRRGNLGDESHGGRVRSEESDESRGGRVNTVVCEPTPPAHYTLQTTTHPTPNVDAPN